MHRHVRATLRIMLVLGPLACGGSSPAADTSGTESTTSTGATGTSSSDTTSQSATADASTTATLPLPPGSGCCAAHAGPGCDEPEVQACVCELAAQCCAFDWDDDCTTHAITCEATCMSDDGTASRSTTESDDSAGESTESGDSGATTGGDVGTCCETSNAPGCSVPAVEACVCGGDPFCCAMQWDHLCVARASQSCDIDCANDCCAPHDAVACNDVDVFSCVADADGNCYGQWDAQCVQVATTRCGLSCG